jgi:hypothetical protein
MAQMVEHFKTLSSNPKTAKNRGGLLVLLESVLSEAVNMEDIKSQPLGTGLF